MQRAPRHSIIALALAIAALASCRRAGEPARFVGSARCAGCHAAQDSAWRRSQHAVAMQEATPRTVLGRFDGQRFTHEGVTSTFLRRGGRFQVETEGADGEQHTYDISYTFGVYPLQQYLVEFPGGRLQALSVAWDARPAAEGGQRWFFLYPAARITHTDERHWTGRRQNWNYMCADCHSTAVRKGYVEATDSFHTTRAEIAVGCEACHGPGSRHASGPGWRWLRSLTGRGEPMPARLEAWDAGRWVLDSGARIARKATPGRASQREIEVCAQCHARRVHFADGYTAGAPFLDYYIPLLLERGQYFPDGQQRDEVYTYAPFLQSRMYAAGVTCSDCHDPHSGKLRRPGNLVCEQCHAPSAYDTPRHHFHAEGTEAARCTSCHMMTRTYMLVDPRHDHSMRVPRPDRSAALGTPDPCTGCHTGKEASWAAERIRAVRASPAPGFQRFAEAFALDEREDPAAAEPLARIVDDTTQPTIVRASALSRLADYSGELPARAARRWSSDPSPLVRLAALQILERWAPRERGAIALPALGDSTRAVRQAAAWLLAADTSLLRTAPQKRAFARAAAEFIDSQRYNADQPENRLALGLFHAMLGDLAAAESELRAATRIAPRYAAAWVMLSRVMRLRGRDADAERALREGLAQRPGDPDLTRELAAGRGRPAP
ncbi:MAG TPA: multiheme c-type cytochrome [Gemmatimonadaceae bacterium]|nr:multiheme c-type cytochrome [Gemmatimonadaceae bacterium]